MDILIDFFQRPLVIYFLSFVVVAVASREIGHFLGKYNLPHITGYLFAGLLVGPFVLNLVPSEAIERLRFVDELSLAVIAFVAGAELYLKELRSRIRPILLSAAGVLVAALTIGTFGIFLLTNIIPFTQGLPATSRFAVALLGSTVLLALSPASTIAVIQEMRAKGSFTKTVLSITVVMDVVIIIFFAISTAVAAALLNDAPMSVSFVGLVALDIGIAIASGVVVGLLLRGLLGSSLPRFVKIIGVLLVGYGTFAGGFWLTDFSKANLPLELHFEPLLAAMVAGFYMTNYTRYRKEFEQILHDVSPFVYVAFFTLTGIALKLDILVASGLIALILFGLRALNIVIGAFNGATLAGEPKQVRRIMWMGLITQAGIALGLAREVAVEFPGVLGDSFATLIIAVVVLNEIFGPLFLKYALRKTGEAVEPETAETIAVRDAVILGVEGQSLALARELKQHNWCVILADTDAEHIERLAAEDVDERHIEGVNVETMSGLMTPNTDAVVAMLEDDDANFRALEIARNRYGVSRLIARPNDPANTERLASLGASVVNPTSALISLLDQMVRAPQTAALVLEKDPDYTLQQITITEKDLEGVLLRDLRLPTDVLIMEITRNGHSVVPHGYTPLHVGDDLIMIGKPESLEQVTLRMGY